MRTKLSGSGNSRSMESFKNRVLNACDELSGKKILRKKEGNTWLRNVKVKRFNRKKKEAHRTLCKSLSENNLAKHKALKNKAKKRWPEKKKMRLKKRLKTLAEITSSSV